MLHCLTGIGAHREEYNMSISGLTPTSALPGLATGGMLAGSNPLLAAPGNSLIGGSPLLGAQAGVIEKPGIGTRFVNAMKAAIGELRGGSPVGYPTQSLAMQAPLASAPVTVKKPAAAPKRAVKAKTYTDKAGNLRQIGTGKILKPTTRPAANAVPQGPAQPQQQLPANAAQIPGATVYSYDQFGNPVAPTMQQLGMTPTMLQGLEGMVGGQDPDGPQVNATNQTNLGGLGTGLGMGSAVPVLGAPILTTPAVTSPGDTPAGTGTGGSQTVTNRNDTDIANRNQGVMPGYGTGWGGTPWNGIATPSAPYGSSMTGSFLR
jgi:hypothetical protein